MRRQPDWARWALAALLLDALGALGLAAFVLLHTPGQGAWLNAGDAAAGAVLQVVWTWLLSGLLLRGEAADSWNGWLTAYRAVFPLLTAWRGLIFVLTFFGVMGGVEGVGVLSVLVLFIAWGGSIVASLAVFSFSVRLLLEPASDVARLGLRRWLEWAAILGAAGTVTNLYPPLIDGLSRPDGWEVLVYGGTGALDVVALLLLRRALKRAPAKG